MSRTLLQVFGGVFSLLNKIFLSQTERSDGSKRRRFRIWSWIVLLISLPSWIVIFGIERNWIAVAVQIGGAPAMVLGLVIAVRGAGEQPKWLDLFALTATITGLGCSIYDFGWMIRWIQIFELIFATTFLIGTYTLAKQKLTGYLWSMLMNT